jgi:N-acetylmuramoyl-L-alanine amidase
MPHNDSADAEALREAYKALQALEPSEKLQAVRWLMTKDISINDLYRDSNQDFLNDPGMVDDYCETLRDSIFNGWWDEEGLKWLQQVAFKAGREEIVKSPVDEMISKIDEVLDVPPPYHQHVKFSQDEKDIVAAVLIGEAGGERDPGMQAVMNVIMNRAKKPERFVSTVLRRRHFAMFNSATGNASGVNYDIVRSIVSDYKKHPCWNKAQILVSQATHGELPDVTEGATHYYSCKMPKAPLWAQEMKETTRIGNHIFMKEEPSIPRKFSTGSKTKPLFPVRPLKLGFPTSEYR